jgi:hypothetical protein
LGFKVNRITNSDPEFLLRRIEDLEAEILRLKDRPIAPLGSVSVRNLSSPSESNAGILSAILNYYVPQERITTTGTSHALAAPPGIDPDGNPQLVLTLNGAEMFRGGTSNLGWSFSGTNTITTVRSMTASDFLWAKYIKAS